MGDAWSSIRDLKVVSRISDEASAGVVPLPPASRPSFSSLIHFAIRCRSLEVLHINTPPRDMSEAELTAFESYAKADGDGLTPQPRLRRLTPGYFRDCRWFELSLPDVDRLAKVLCSLFPSLDRTPEDILEICFCKEDLLRDKDGAGSERCDMFRLVERIAALGQIPP
ncbi:hypothetical protein GY45DRAFT_986173 [Cubamyces sp. BRFM 1775]|nr:hypothetical protein GY45DRAFT_986173 [Cubamyces sp. BRFM 1775]